MYVKVSAYHSSYYLTTLQGPHGHTLLMAVAVDSGASKPMGSVSFNLAALCYLTAIVFFCPGSALQNDGLDYQKLSFRFHIINLRSRQFSPRANGHQE